jgi:hypothetical protein
MKQLEFKGTKGEWRFNQGVEVDSSCRAVYRLSTAEDPTREEYNANKKLFYASRDLLEALQSFVNINSIAREHINDEVFIKGNQAINKAL